MIQNRFEKNYKKLKSYLSRHQIEAFRLYDRDIPEVPYIIDVYKDHFVVYDKTDPVKDAGKNLFPEIESALKNLFQADIEKIILKKRQRQEGTQQYQKLGENKDFFVVRESQAQFYVNLKDYLDTGLFLDHRPMRQKVFKESQGKRVLNLFSYTGSVSVFAALGGGKVTSVDMSRTYMDWAQDNFELNQIDFSGHSFIVENALQWMHENRNQPKYDLIFLDPPTFSNSKKMSHDFDVERDQGFLVDTAMSMLKPQGVLYFSNNKRKFRLEPRFFDQYQVLDLTEKSIPQDFHDQKIHCCFEIRRK